MKNNQLIKRSELVVLSAVLGACAIKSLGSDMFISVIKLKSAMSKEIEKGQELFKRSAEEFGIHEGNSHLITGDMKLKLDEVSMKLSSELVEVPNLKILSEQQFISLSDENPKLNTDHLETIYKWMVESQ